MTLIEHASFRREIINNVEEYIQTMSQYIEVDDSASKLPITVDIRYSDIGYSDNFPQKYIPPVLSLYPICTVDG